MRDYGRLDVLVNNAGWDRPGPFATSEPQTWDRVVAINFMGVVNCCHAALQPMLKQQRGSIVSIASDAGRVGSKGEAVYSGAKGGVIALTKALAREVARQHIRLNAVSPGPTQTPLIAEAFGDNPKLVEAVTRGIPMGRMAEPDEIASAVAFLVSDDARFITGQTLSVSGGLTMC
jgi:2-hydroxycyclohexanecarboxyl-CoA dehydrogenase